MASSNGLVCFTNCLLPTEDGALIEQDLWIDERRGVVLDAQRTFFLRGERPDKIIDLGGNILSPGFLDIQINGAYKFDFSVFEGDAKAYREGLKVVAQKIVETGVTSFCPTTITQEKSLYPTLLNLLRPYSSPTSATVLGWHAEGPFIQMAKRGAHAPQFLLKADEGFKSIEKVYGPENLAVQEDWLMACDDADGVGVRIITAAPEIAGVLPGMEEAIKRGITYSIGHSIATTDMAWTAVQSGARLITHLFNAMPQMHHRDPSIIGLLGASPMGSPHDPSTPASENFPQLSRTASTTSMASRILAANGDGGAKATSEAFDELVTPPQTPRLAPLDTDLHLTKGETVALQIERPFYELIVDGIHSHPNSVRLAYSTFPERCILITDAMKILDPHLKDGVHEWRDGKRFVKQGDKLFLEGTDTLAGSVVTLDKCVRNFVHFTGCSLGEAIKCATYNPALCLNIENKKGTLRHGADADLVVLDRRGFPQSTWIKGKKVWEKSS